MSWNTLENISLNNLPKIYKILLGIQILPRMSHPYEQMLHESNFYQIMQYGLLKDLLQNNLLRLNSFTDFE